MRSRHIQRAQAKAQLLGPDGTPIAQSGQIPFIQWLPDGKSMGRMIERSAKVCVQAKRFIRYGGRYSYVLRKDNMAELVAGFPVKGGEKGEMYVVAEEVVANGPDIEPAVDRLVAFSVANLDNLPISEVVH